MIVVKFSVLHFISLDINNTKKKKTTIFYCGSTYEL